MAVLDPTIIQTALLQVAEATKAASEAAKAVLAQQQSRGSAGPAALTVVDWNKLVNKPPCFERSTVEGEIKAFRDWNWQVT